LSDRVGTRLVKRRVAASTAFEGASKYNAASLPRHVENPPSPRTEACPPSLSDPKPDAEANALSRAARVPHLRVVLPLSLSLMVMLVSLDVARALLTRRDESGD